MKTGVVIYSNDPETVWNAFRFGNFALAMGDEVRVFLLGKGVEMEALDNGVFKVSEQVKTLLETGGEIYACGVCLEIHQIKPSDRYSVSSMRDLYQIVKESDRVVNF